MGFKRAVVWEYDEYACMKYNILAKFETTLINFGIIDDYADIEETEKFVEKFGLKGVNNE